MHTTACFTNVLVKEKAEELFESFETDPIERNYIRAIDELPLNWQQDIDLLHHIYDLLVTPNHLRTEQPVFTGAEFNL